MDFSVTQLPSTPLSYLLKHKVQVILCGSLFFHPLDLSGRRVEAGSQPSLRSVSGLQVHMLEGSQSTSGQHECLHCGTRSLGWTIWHPGPPLL